MARHLSCYLPTLSQLPPERCADLERYPSAVSPQLITSEGVTLTGSMKFRRRMKHPRFSAQLLHYVPTCTSRTVKMYTRKDIVNNRR